MFDPIVYDPRENTWIKWRETPKKLVGDFPCLVSWKDLIFAIGGKSNSRGVQIYNSTANHWSVLDAKSSPFELHSHTCTLLPTNEILVVGIPDDSSLAALFNIETNSWEQLENMKYRRHGATFVNLNDRIFLFGGNNFEPVVEEYHYGNRSWSVIIDYPIKPPLYASALALPGVNFINVLRAAFVPAEPKSVK